MSLLNSIKNILYSKSNLSNYNKNNNIIFNSFIDIQNSNIITVKNPYTNIDKYYGYSAQSV
ncbi:hypothetical protein DICPUDRAFT_157885 [Dictyostelium purpureum]|uniref:Uncharacterized protein n=1 Tax=Dictyostelium purpureum TaxID=5786 RepID=F1A093_DICPU|nr:uncharacterized protein DICPUDRAFT_157885 [Dictyostelium purpureum]EGC30385.1 hypothetical protein DICPUDRAFT_157885 [Dictyostelium purpureum]|eukprot:XP_003293082.1 hypothetical protein DICPUDRAFT_157885 [Dictyostelium purpureum]